jgi:glycosyltransferase involved in cell wall biosynthesis
MSYRDSPASSRRAHTPPSISLVTCSYQQGRYLEQTLRSVLDQGYPRLEYIVIDGGSSDGSVGILRRYAPALAHWVSEPDRGQTDALTKGFARATGEVCGWLCSDDLLLPGALQAVGEFFASHPQVMAAYGDALWVDGAGRYLRPKKEMRFSRFVMLHDHNYVPQPAMFWRRALYEAVGGLDATFDLAMDADLWERFSTRTRIARIPRYLACMRFYPEQKTRARQSEGRREDGALRARDRTLAASPRAVVRMLARCVRIAAKAASGGYTARAPREHVAWLERRAANGPRL